MNMNMKRKGSIQGETWVFITLDIQGWKVCLAADRIVGCLGINSHFPSLAAERIFRGLR